MIGWVRRNTLPKLDPAARRVGRPLIREKSRREYLFSVACEKGALQRAVKQSGYSTNPFATLKYVEDGQRVYEAGSLAWRQRPLAHDQLHLYYFPAREPDYTFHLHQHREINWLRHPIEHMGPGQEPGDHDGVLSGALQEYDLTYVEVDYPEYRRG